MALKTWSQYYTIASTSGASGLALITDATHDDDPSGTICNAAYWEAHAYDALEVIFTRLGSNPGLGVDGTTFTINQDAVSPETQSLQFFHGSSGSPPFLQWHSSGYFQFNQTVRPYVDSSYDLGTSAVRWRAIYCDEIDATTITGIINVTGTAEAEFTIDSDDTIYTAGTGKIKVIASRGADAEGDAELQWDEDDLLWYLIGPDPEDSGDPNTFHTRQIVRAGDIDTITVEMLDESSVYEDTGGDYGTESTAARSDHSHSGATFDADGTTAESFTLDSDYASGSQNIELRFASASNCIRFNPSIGIFRFSATLTSDQNNTDDLGSSIIKWKDLHLSGDANIGTDATIGGDATISGAIDVTGEASFDDSFITLDADDTVYDAGTGSVGIAISRGAATDVTLHWDEDNSVWRVLDTAGNSHTIATLTQAQSLSSKTIVEPTITSGGSWDGNPSFTGSPVFSSNPSFTGNPSFSGTPVLYSDGTKMPNFTVDGGNPPFKITISGSPATASSITNLDADKVDGQHSTTFLYRDGSLAMTGNLDMGGYSLTNGGNITVTGGSISGITDLAVADGGTGASSAANARTNLGAFPLLTTGTGSGWEFVNVDLGFGNFRLELRYNGSMKDSWNS